MRTHLLHLIAVVVSVIVLVTALSLTRLAIATTAQNVWMSIGLQRALIVALAVDPQRPTTLYAGSFLDGVYQSIDGGGHWQIINEGLPSGPFAEFLAIDPHNPNTIYVLGGRIAESIQARIFKSTNGGRSWSASSAGLPDIYVKTLVIDPQRPSTLYAGALPGGVFKSNDAGGSWRAVSNGLNRDIGVYALVVDPRTPTTLYAGTMRGVFKSTNGASSWRLVGTDLAASNVPRLAIDPQNPTTLYVVAWGGFGGRDTPCGVFKSTDGGEMWHAINPSLGIPCGDTAALAIDPELPTTIYAGTSKHGVFKSTDGGGNWHSLNGDFGVAVLAIDPKTPTTIYAGGAGGVFILRQ